MSFRSWTFLLPLGLIFLLLAVLAVRQVGSLDVGFHLEAGEHILSGNGWPDNDPFTYTVNDRPYIDTSWGYQVVLASIQRLAGAPGLVLFHAGLVLVIFVLLYGTARLADAAPGPLLLSLLLAVMASEMRFETRPELLSYTLLVLVLYLLHRHSEGRDSPLYLLPAIFLVWANCHSLYVLGWVALGCFAVGPLLRHRRADRKLSIWAAASLPVVLINPYGWKAVAFPFTLATRLSEQNVFNRSIGEFVSPFSLNLSEQFPFYPQAPIWAFRLLFVLVVLSLVPLLRQKRIWCVLLALPFLYLSFRMVRNMPLLVVAALPGTVWGLSPAPGRGARRIPGWWPRAVAVAVAAIALLLALRVYNDAYYVASRRVERFGWGWNHTLLPEDVVRYAKRSGLTGRVLNHLNFGGYLMWARSQPVFIDGRLEVVGERFYEYYRRVLASEDAMEACVARYGIRWIVFPYATNPKLLQRLSRDRKWRLTYVDHLAAVFVREDGETSALVDESARLAESLTTRPTVLEGLPGIGGAARRGKARRWLEGFVRRQSIPTEPAHLGLFHHYRGRREWAAPYFAQAIRESDGAYYEHYNNLGSALYRQGRLAEAGECYRIVLEDAPSNRLARERLAEIGRADPGEPYRQP